MSTIAAIATAHGVGAISIIRVSGAHAKDIALALTKRKDFKPRHAHLCDLFTADDTLIDKAIVIYFQNPHSFTGEDIVEFQTHGGLAVSRIVLELLIDAGAVHARAGEFSKRAFLNGKIDLSEAEAISKMIESKSTEAVKILASQLNGELKIFVDMIRDALLEVLAYVEVNIDYAEEDLPPEIEDMIVQKVDRLTGLLERTLRSSKEREGMIEGYKVSIIGKPNVGKSSLLNSMLDYDRAIISDIAGTTRDTIEEHITVGTHVIKIIDTAGIRESSEQIEKIGIQRSLSAIENSDITIYMFDSSHEQHEDDFKIKMLYDRYANKDNSIVIFNKTDLPKKLELAFKDIDVVEISAKHDSSLVKDKIISILDEKSNSEEIMLTSSRQVHAIKTTKESLEESLIPLANGELELFAYNINDAIMQISFVTKSYERDEILDKMFGEFCLGK